MCVCLCEEEKRGPSDVKSPWQPFNTLSSHAYALSMQLFTSFFKTLVGKTVVVELKNDLRCVAFSFLIPSPFRVHWQLPVHTATAWFLRVLYLQSLTCCFHWGCFFGHTLSLPSLFRFCSMQGTLVSVDQVW